MSRFSDLFSDKTFQEQKIEEVKVQSPSEAKEVKPTHKKKGKRK